MKTGEMTVAGSSEGTGKSLLQTVYVWEDSTWRYSEEYSWLEDGWKGDDYCVVAFPVTATEEDIEEAIVKYFGGV